MQYSYQGRGLKQWGALLIIGFMVFVLAACTSDSSNGNAAKSANGETSTGTNNSTKANTNADKASEEATKSSETRTVKDAYGEVTVPANPSKIVVLDIGGLDNLLELGIKPIGAPSILAAGDPYPAYLKGTDGITNIGSVNEPNLEAIDALKPDLIIGNKDAHDALYGQLGKIAPTVFVETLGVTWKANLLLHAEAVNKQDEGKKLLETYEAKISDFKAKNAEQGGKTVSLIRPRADKIQAYLKDNFAGTIMADAGVSRPEAQQVEGFSKDVTEEQMVELDGDVILWLNREPDAFAKLEKSPLWAGLSGVKANQVYPADWEYWMSGLGIQAVNKVVDDLQKFLLK